MGTTTVLGFVPITMIVMGVGFGVINNIFTLAVQNAVPAGRLGVGTGAINYLRVTGQTVGTAVLATLVVNGSSSKLASYLPAAARRLPSSVLAQAANQQVLVDPGKQHLVVQAAVQQAAAQVPAGPAHAQQVAQFSAQISHLFAQIFAAARVAPPDWPPPRGLLFFGASVASFSPAPLP